jgi:predicted Fe-Mo cluster-binding NifX family protein
LDSRSYTKENLVDVATAGLLGAVAGGGTSLAGTVVPSALTDAKNMFGSKANADKQIANAKPIESEQVVPASEEVMNRIKEDISTGKVDLATMDTKQYAEYRKGVEVEMSKSKPVKSEDGSVSMVHENGKATPFAELNEVEKVEAIVSDIKNVSTSEELAKHKSIWDMEDDVVQDVLGSAEEAITAMNTAKAELSKLPDTMREINAKLLNEISKKSGEDLFGMNVRLYSHKGARTVEEVLAKFDTVNISKEAQKQLGVYLKAEYNAMAKRIAFVGKAIKQEEPKASKPIDSSLDEALSHYSRQQAIESTSASSGQTTEKQANAIAFHGREINKIRESLGMSIKEFNIALKNKKEAKDNADVLKSLQKERPHNIYYDKDNNPIYEVKSKGKTVLVSHEGKIISSSKGRSSIDVLESKGISARVGTREENSITIKNLQDGKAIKKTEPKENIIEVKQESSEITSDIFKSVDDVRKHAVYTKPEHNGFNKIFSEEGISDVMDFVKTYAVDKNIFLRKAGITADQLAQRHGEAVDTFKKFHERFNTMFFTTMGTDNPFVNKKGEVNAPSMAKLFADRVIDGKTFGYSEEFAQYAMMIAMEKVANGTPVGSTDSSKEWLEEHFENDKSAIREALQFGGIPIVSNTHGIGRDVIKASGYKISNDIEFRELTHAEEEIGHTSLHTLIALELVQTKTIHSEDNPALSLTLIRLPRSKTNTTLKDVHAFVSPIADSLNVYDRPIPKLIKLGEKVKLRKDIQGHDLTINEAQEQALVSQNSREFTLNNSMYSFFDGREYSDDEVASILGLPSQAEIDGTNINWRDNLISTRNAGILSFRNSNEFFRTASELEPEDAVWSYEHFFTISGRSMTNSSGGADYQNDKAFSRFMVDTYAYNGTVTEKNQAIFKFGVLQSLEHYAEGVIGKDFKAPDKVTAEVNAKNFKALIAHIRTEINMKGSHIEILINQSKYSEAQVSKAINDIGNIHGLRGVTSLLEVIDKIDNNGNVKESFETKIILETDGVTNGLSHLMWQSMVFADKKGLVPRMKQMAARVGLYTVKEKTYQQWKADGNDDTYEWIAKAVDEQVRFIPEGKTAANRPVRSKLAIAVIDEIKRKIAKNPVMVFQYGSSANNIAKKVGEEYTETMFKQFVGNKDFTEHLDSVSGKYKGDLHASVADKIQDVIKKMKKATTTKDRLELVLTDKEMESLVTLFSKAVGQKFGEVMSDKFNEIGIYQDAAMKSVEIGRRLLAENQDYKDAVEVINDKASTVAQVKEAKKKMLEIAPKYQNASGYVNGTHTHDQPVVDINPAFVRENEKRQINIKTHKDSKSNLTMQYHTKTYELPVGGSNAKGYSSTKMGDKKWAVVGIHNIDGTIMFDVLNNTNLLQVFDAILTGVDGAVQGSEIYNKSYMNINTGYSLIASIRNGLADYISANEQHIEGLTVGYNVASLDKEAIVELQTKFNKSFHDEENKVLKVPAVEFIKYLDKTIAEGQGNVAQFANHIKSVGQMSGLDTGSYMTTPEDRASYVENANAVEFKSIEKDMDYMDDYTDEELGTDSEAFSSKIKKTFDLAHDASALTNIFNHLGKFYGKASNNAELKAIIQEVSNVLGQPIKDSAEKVFLVQAGKQSHGKVNLVSGNITIAPTKSMLSTTSMTAQESFVHELVHKATEYALRGSMQLKMRADKLLRDLSKVMTYEDYKKNVMAGRIDSMIDEKEAKKRYDYIMSSPSEMIAFAKTNEGFSSYLDKLQAPVEELSFLARIGQMFEDAIAFVLNGFKSHKTTGNFKTDIDRLTADLYKMNQQYQNSESIRQAYGKDNIIDEYMDKFDLKIVEQSNALLKRAMDGTVDLRAKLGALKENNLVKKIVNNKLLRSMKTELAGHGSKVKSIIDLMRVKENNQRKYSEMRKYIKDSILASLNGATAEEETALQSVLVDADISALGMKPDEIAKLLTDDVFLDSHINDIEKQLYMMAKGEGNKRFINYARNQAEGLGYYLATNIIGIPHGQMFNAKNIASGKYANGSFKVVNGVEPMIDKLATLYALKYENKDTKAVASNFIVNNKDGVSEVIAEYAHIKKYSEKTLFSDVGQSHLAIKGYSYEAFDASIDMTVVDEEKVHEMSKRGYKVVGKTMPTTMIEGSKARYIMSRPNIETRYTEGLMDVTQMKHKSSEMIKDEKMINADMSYQMEKKIQIGGHTGQFMAPLLSPKQSDGVVGYRYMASKSMKANILNQDRKISTGLSEYHSMTMRKVEGLAINRSTINALIKDMDNVATEPDAFIDIDFNDEKVQAMYSIMPPLTRKYLKNALRGTDNMLKVRKDIVDQVFGYKNFSVTQLEFFKKHETLKWVVGLSEKIWMDISSHVRESIVFKTLDVVLDNLISNVIMLSVYGMNPIAIVQGMNEGRVLMNKFRTDTKAYNMIDLRRKRGLSYDAVELARLANAIKHNKVKILVESGQFQSIIDETEIEYDSTTNLVENFGSNITSKLPTPIKNTIDFLYMDKNTKTFQFFMKFVQYSDFVGKYAYYKHATEKKGVKSEDAIDEVEEMFINYSLIQHKALKYGSDMSPLRFMKYLLRVQRVIGKMVSKKTSRASAEILTQKLLGDIADPIDSALPFVSAGRFMPNPVDTVLDLTHAHTIEAVDDAINMLIPAV